MSTVQVTKCNVCGAHKKEVNHWYLVWIYDRSFQCAPVLSLHPFDNTEKDVCGRECASKLFSRFLETGSLEPKP